MEGRVQILWPLMAMDKTVRHPRLTVRTVVSPTCLSTVKLLDRLSPLSRHVERDFLTENRNCLPPTLPSAPSPFEPNLKKISERSFEQV